MDILIKRKNYKDALEFLYDRQSDSDWNIFIDAIRNNFEFLEYFKEFSVNLNCHFKLKTFLLKIFTHNKDKYFQEIVYDIILHLHDSTSELGKHLLIQNLLFIQTIKLVVLDENNRDKLEEVIKYQSIDADWFLELLENFQLWNELGLFYELRGDFEKCLIYYKKTNKKSEKIKEINEILNKSNYKAEIIETGEENFYECEQETLKNEVRVIFEENVE
jgi:hypothetical protein